MSSVKYGDKSPEEIRALVDKYRENYRKMFGCYPDTTDLRAKLDDLRIKKEQDLFASLFADLPVSNIGHAVSVLTEMEKAAQPQKKNKFFAKG